MSDHSPPQIPGYALERELGVGGMATVYLANQVSLDRRVAIKILRVSAHDAADPERHEKRFLREGKMLARLSHRNVCGIFDIAKVGNLAYIAMEFIDGGTLGDRLRRGMTAAEAISVIVQLASALAAAHAIGIVHRDLKPANVMMRGKVPVLTDFGIARDLTSDRTEITGDNILGTPNYMSPEQISGQPIDGRSDIYSLGAMLYELLTGRQPYFGDSPIAVCMQHLQAPIPELPEPFTELQPVIDGMMAKSRDDRIPDMPGVVLALRAALLDSETLRTALRFDTELPFSEQLRELGFSFEGSTSGQWRSAVKPRKPATTGDVTNGKSGRAPVVGKPPDSSPRPEERPTAVSVRRPSLWIGVVTALLLLVVSSWWWLSRDLSQRDLALLQTLATVFDQRMDQGQLDQPPQESALGSLELLHGISRTHALVLERDARFRSAIEAEVDKLAAKEGFGQARDLLTKSALAFADAEFEQRLARLDQAQQAAGRDKNIAEQIAKLDQILTTADGIDNPLLGPTLRDLLDLTALTDPRYQAQTTRIAATLTTALDQALARKRPDQAAAVRDRLRELLPAAVETRAAISKVEALAAQLAAEQTQGEVEALLQGESFTPAVVDQVLAGLSNLRSAELEATPLRKVLVARTIQGAEQALRSNDLATARAFIGPVLQRFADNEGLRALDARLTAAEAQLAESRRAEEERARTGRLAVDAFPWGEVVSVVGSGNQNQKLASDRTTPLLLTLPEGSYAVTIKGPDGKTQQANAVVKRGEISVAELSFAALDADTYLKQAGYR